MGYIIDKGAADIDFFTSHIEIYQRKDICLGKVPKYSSIKALFLIIIMLIPSREKYSLAMEQIPLTLYALTLYALN